MRRHSGVILAVAASIALLASCQESPKPRVEAESQPGTPETQIEALHSPDTTPAAPSSTMVSALPTPSSSDLATVGGVFLRDLEDGGSGPGVDTKLQLARVIRSEDGTPLVASAGEKSSPTIVTAQDGSFVFTDIPADTYVLVAVTPLGSFMIKDKAGENLFVDVQSGGVLDLGEVHTGLPY